MTDLLEEAYGYDAGTPAFKRSVSREARFFRGLMDTNRLSEKKAREDISLTYRHLRYLEHQVAGTPFDRRGLARALKFRLALYRKLFKD